MKRKAANELRTDVKRVPSTSLNITMSRSKSPDLSYFEKQSCGFAAGLSYPRHN